MERRQRLLGLRRGLVGQLRPNPKSSNQTQRSRQVESLGLYERRNIGQDVDLFERLAMAERYWNAPANPCNGNAARRSCQFGNRMVRGCLSICNVQSGS